MIGPVAAGALIAAAGTLWVFALNALLSVAAAVALWRWRREVHAKALPAERFVGAISAGVQHAWSLFADTARPGRYVEYFVDESWVEHLRRFDRMTAADHALHRGPAPPWVTRSLAMAVDAG